MKKGRNRYSAPKKAPEYILAHRRYAKERRLKRMLSLLFLPVLCIAFGALILTIVFVNRDPYENIRQSITIHGKYESITYTSIHRGSSYSTIRLAGTDETYTINTMMFKYPAYEAIAENVAPGTPITLIASDTKTHVGNRRVYAVSVDGVPALTTEDTVKAYEENNRFGLGFGLLFLLPGIVSAIIFLFVYFDTRSKLQKSI